MEMKTYEFDGKKYKAASAHQKEWGKDPIFSNAALHWVKDHNRLLHRSYTALTAGGILLWDFGSHGNCSHFLAVIHETIKEGKYHRFFKNFEMPWFMPSKYQYEKLLAKIGFSEFTVTEVNRDRYFPSSEEMIRWIDQPCIVPFMEQIPDTLKSAFRKDVIEKMLAKTQQQDGTCFETFRRLQIYARK